VRQEAAAAALIGEGVLVAAIYDAEGGGLGVRARGGARAAPRSDSGSNPSLARGRGRARRGVPMGGKVRGAEQRVGPLPRERRGRSGRLGRAGEKEGKENKRGRSGPGEGGGPDQKKERERCTQMHLNLNLIFKFN
jgi:hypothetical protein